MKQVTRASGIIDEAIDAGLDGSHPLTVQAKMLRLELPNVKADLERELAALRIDLSTGCRVIWPRCWPSVGDGKPRFTGMLNVASEAPPMRSG